MESPIHRPTRKGPRMPGNWSSSTWVSTRSPPVAPWILSMSASRESGGPPGNPARPPRRPCPQGPHPAPDVDDPHLLLHCLRQEVEDSGLVELEERWMALAP